MREHVSRQKKTTTGFSIPSLKQPIPGFGLESSVISRQAAPEIQSLRKPVTHDISRIPLRTQAKLSISQPGDKYEQEADSVAQQVMQKMAQPVNRQSIHRETLPESEELQMKPLANSITPLVQREALPEDEEELQMKSLDNSTLQREALPEDEEELQMKSLDNSTLQREALPEDEEELQMKPMVQRQANAGMAATPDLEASINQARGGGVAIADNIREPMEHAFGADFSGVKVHTDGQSDQLNRSIQARAFTTGQDVFFRSGEYNPGSRGGQELLAHELTHVVQQKGGAVQRSSLLPQQLPQYPTTEIPSVSEENRVFQRKGEMTGNRQDSPLEQRLNQTGLPDALKTGAEHLGGVSLNDVKVHYNSTNPAQINALAYAQGNDIYIAPGQEQHLPHEAWHVVQQAQGRVKPTMQMKDGIQVNDHEGLEHEADVMGAKALANDGWSHKEEFSPVLRAKSKFGSEQIARVKVIQKVPLKSNEFRQALVEHIFGDGDSYPTIGGVIKRPVFFNDLMQEAGTNLDSSNVQRLGSMVYRFIREMDAALKYRADKADTVRAMKAQFPNANFGDVYQGERLIGGTSNPWPTVYSAQLPRRMKDHITTYIPHLHNSVSLGGGGYDYRPARGILFHIKS